MPPGLFAPYRTSRARRDRRVVQHRVPARNAGGDLPESRWQTGAGLQVLKVDGGITGNDLCMQIQADVLVWPVRPVVAETTAEAARKKRTKTRCA